MNAQEEHPPQSSPYGDLPKENADKNNQPFWKNPNLILAIVISALSIIILLKMTPPSKSPEANSFKANVQAKVSEPVSFENLRILVKALKGGSTDSQATVTAKIENDNDSMEMTIQKGGRVDFAGYAITVTDLSVSDHYVWMFITQSSIK